MPQLDPHVFAPQLIWLAISFAILYFLMAKVALPRVGRVMEERQERIEDNLETAEELKKQADAEAEAHQKALVGAREQARSAIQQAVTAEQATASAKQEELGNRLAAQIRDAEAEIVRAKTAARASVREAAVGVALAAVERLIGTKPNESAVGGAVDNALRARQ